PTEADDRHFGTLEQDALNCVRGSAGYSIGQLLAKHPSMYGVLGPAIEHLTQYSNIAVRVAGLEACLPMLAVDKNQALQWYLSAILDSPDPILATRQSQRLIRYTYLTHLEQLRPVLGRMIRSLFEDVAEAGAYWVTAVFLVTDAEQGRYEECLSGTAIQRRGVAKVSASLLAHADHWEKAQSVLFQLADDPDESVRREVANCFRKIDLQKTGTPRSWARFARSRAFRTEPSHLLQALENQSGDLLPFADCILAVATSFAEDFSTAIQDPSSSLALEGSHYLVPLLLRLYEQAEGQNPVLHQNCLDLWDRLLEARVGSAIGLNRKIDDL
ncbi:MAG: hypothetical protein AAFY88_31770, partial [Acidobacteriota bacterium]